MKAVLAIAWVLMAASAAGAVSVRLPEGPR